jgi:hypothetical protein
MVKLAVDFGPVLGSQIGGDVGGGNDAEGHGQTGAMGCDCRAEAFGLDRPRRQ